MLSGWKPELQSSIASSTNGTASSQPGTPARRDWLRAKRMMSSNTMLQRRLLKGCDWNDEGDVFMAGKVVQASGLHSVQEIRGSPGLR